MAQPDFQRESAGILERTGTFLDAIRTWILRGWRMALMMGKGAYMVGERRRLFEQLGEEVYGKVQGGMIKDSDLQPLVEQLERLTKRVEIEENMIRSVRFGNQTMTGRPLPDKESKQN